MLKKLLILSACLLVTSCASQFGPNGASPTSSHADAYQTGMRYMLGRGTEQDYDKARSYFEKAADQENPYAENELGYMYSSGKGVEKNYDLAIEYYERASHHGLASAQFNLGVMYANGIGTPVNKTKARILFQKAAKRGFAPAQRALAAGG